MSENKTKQAALSLVGGVDSGAGIGARSYYLRNWIALLILAALYAHVVHLAGGLHLLIAPLAMAPLGYHAFKGKPLIRKVLASTIPWAGSPALALLGADNVIETAFVHSFLIGLVTVQVWEAMLWLGGYLMNKLHSLIRDQRKT